MSTDASKIPTITGGLVHHRDTASTSGSHVRVETNLQKIVLMQRHAERSNPKQQTHRSTTPFLSFFPLSSVSFTKKDNRRRPTSRPLRFNLLGKPIDENLLKSRKRLAFIRKVQFLTHNFLERPDSKGAISYHILQ